MIRVKSFKFIGVKRQVIKIISLISAICTTNNVVFMDVDLKGISNITLIDLIFLSSFTFSILSSNKCRTQQIKNLSVNFLHCISNSNKARDWSRDITLNIKKRAVSINLYNFLIHCARAFVTHMTSHSTAFKDFTWVFTHTNRAWCSVCS